MVPAKQRAERAARPHPGERRADAAARAVAAGARGDDLQRRHPDIGRDQSDSERDHSRPRPGDRCVCLAIFRRVRFSLSTAESQWRRSHYRRFLATWRLLVTYRWSRCVQNSDDQLRPLDSRRAMVVIEKSAKLSLCQLRRSFRTLRIQSPRSHESQDRFASRTL